MSPAKHEHPPPEHLAVNFQVAPDDGLDGASLMFERFEEKRTPAEQTSRGPRNRNISFFLTTGDGVQVLAAVGVDHGDAHYNYLTAKDFTKRYGTIQCHNRKDLVQWLEMVIKESKLLVSGRIQAEKAQLGLVTPTNPEGLYYIGSKHDKSHLPDGRKINRWFLIDQHKELHTAVMGEERETRDGHYNYVAMEPYASECPLMCSNQTGVTHWLEQFVTHHAPESALHVGDHIRDLSPRSPKDASSPRRFSDGTRGLDPVRVSKRVRVPSVKGGSDAPLTPGTPRNVFAAPPFPKFDLAPNQPTPIPFATDPSYPQQFPVMSMAARPHKLGGAAEASQMKRMKAMHNAADAQATALRSAVLTQLRQEAHGMKAIQEVSRANAAKWVAEAPPLPDAEHVKHFAAVLRSALAGAGLPVPAAEPSVLMPSKRHAKGGSGPSEGDRPGSNERANPSVKVLEVMEALRELESAYTTTQLMASQNLVPLVQAMLAYPESAVVEMAKSTLDPLMTSDPVATLEAGLADRLITVPLPHTLHATLMGIAPTLPAADSYAATPSQAAAAASSTPSLAVSVSVSVSAALSDKAPGQSISFQRLDSVATDATPVLFAPQASTGGNGAAGGPVGGVPVPGLVSAAALSGAAPAGSEASAMGLGAMPLGVSLRR